MMKHSFNKYKAGSPAPASNEGTSVIHLSGEEIALRYDPSNPDYDSIRRIAGEDGLLKWIEERKIEDTRVLSEYNMRQQKTETKASHDAIKNAAREQARNERMKADYEKREAVAVRLKLEAEEQKIRDDYRCPTSCDAIPKPVTDVLPGHPMLRQRHRISKYLGSVAAHYSKDQSYDPFRATDWALSNDPFSGKHTDALGCQTLSLDALLWGIENTPVKTEMDLDIDSVRGINLHFGTEYQPDVQPYRLNDIHKNTASFSAPLLGRPGYSRTPFNLANGYAMGLDSPIPTYNEYVKDCEAMNPYNWTPSFDPKHPDFSKTFHAVSSCANIRSDFFMRQATVMGTWRQWFDGRFVVEDKPRVSEMKKILHIFGGAEYLSGYANAIYEDRAFANTSLELPSHVLHYTQMVFCNLTVLLNLHPFTRISNDVLNDISDPVMRDMAKKAVIAVYDLQQSCFAYSTFISKWPRGATATFLALLSCLIDVFKDLPVAYLNFARWLPDDVDKPLMNIFNAGFQNRPNGLGETVEETEATIERMFSDMNLSRELIDSMGGVVTVSDFAELYMRDEMEPEHRCYPNTHAFKRYIDDVPHILRDSPSGNPKHDRVADSALEKLFQFNPDIPNSVSGFAHKSHVLTKTEMASVADIIRFGKQKISIAMLTTNPASVIGIGWDECPDSTYRDRCHDFTPTHVDSHNVVTGNTGALVTILGLCGLMRGETKRMLRGDTATDELYQYRERPLFRFQPIKDYDHEMYDGAFTKEVEPSRFDDPLPYLQGNDVLKSRVPTYVLRSMWGKDLKARNKIFQKWLKSYRIQAQMFICTGPQFLSNTINKLGEIDGGAYLNPRVCENTLHMDFREMEAIINWDKTMNHLDGALKPHPSPNVPGQYINLPAHANICMEGSMNPNHVWSGFHLRPEGDTTWDQRRIKYLWNMTEPHYLTRETFLDGIEMYCESLDAIRLLQISKEVVDDYDDSELVSPRMAYYRDHYYRDPVSVRNMPYQSNGVLVAMHPDQAWESLLTVPNSLHMAHQVLGDVLCRHNYHKHVLDTRNFNIDQLGVKKCLASGDAIVQMALGVRDLQQSNVGGDVVQIRTEMLMYGKLLRHPNHEISQGMMVGHFDIPDDGHEYFKIHFGIT